MNRLIDRFVGMVDWAAGMFLAAITALIFVSVFFRYLLNWPIPDGYDIARLLLGVAILWGIAPATYRNDHIQVDLLWEWARPGGRRAIDLFAALVTFGAIVVFAWMLARKVMDTRASHQLTFDLHLPVWIFHGLAWLGVFAAAWMAALRFWRLLRGTRG